MAVRNSNLKIGGRVLHVSTNKTYSLIGYSYKEDKDKNMIKMGVIESNGSLKKDGEEKKISFFFNHFL